MEFSRQEYWSGLPFPSPKDLPHPGVEPATLMSPALADGFFTTASPEKIIQMLIIGAFRLGGKKKATAERNIGYKQKYHYRMFFKWLRVAEKAQR